MAIVKSAVKTVVAANSVPSVKKAVAEAVIVAPKAVAEKTATEKSPEGLTLKTVETGIISFKDGGSADILGLITKLGFDRAKVIEAGNKLKAAGKGFLKSDPAKKYAKMAGIIKGLQNRGYKMPSAQ
jgi:hypothetical protein